MLMIMEIFDARFRSGPLLFMELFIGGGIACSLMHIVHNGLARLTILITYSIYYKVS
jgi:hypothetical protein